MKTSLRIATVILISFGCSSGAWAQRGFHGVAARPAMTSQRGMLVGMRTHVSTTQTPRMVTTTTVNGTTSNAIVVSAASPLSLQDLLNPVPGFGFSFVHLAAINRDLGIRALIDPITQMQLALAERLVAETPAVAPVFPVFGSGETPVIIPQQQPQVIIVQQPAPVTEAAAVQATPQPTETPQVGSTPLPDVGEFILVERDGNQIPAVAFTRQGDRIVYVTRQGTRRSMGVIELDPDATVRMNEERGTPLQLPL